MGPNMKIFSKTAKALLLLLIILVGSLFVSLPQVHAATSPDLGDAASFAILGGTEITNVPTSVITGNVGLSPAAGTNYSGLTVSEVSGTILSVDATGPGGTAGNDPYLLTAAKTDLVSAYDALSAGGNAACDTDYGAVTQDLVGLSLAPGVYCADAFELSGTLTLTGSGVWIFRSAATLVTTGTANVVGGDACDVWWKVESSATLGSNTSLIGNILALTSISMSTGATLEGRALARNGAVTLQSNTINQSCVATTARSSITTINITSSATAPGAEECPPLTYVAPIIIESSRVDADSVFISWGPYSGINTFNVRYGLTNGEWLYNTAVTGFSTTINDLPANQPIWIQVAATDNCSMGTYGPAMLVGGPSLPNTGFGPNQNSLSWFIPAGLLIVLSSLSKLIRN